MKKFIKKIVADIKFSDAGQGHKLNEEPIPRHQTSARPVSASKRVAPSQGAQSAGAAALARLEAQNNKQSSGLRAQQLELKKQIQRQQSAERSANVVSPIAREPEVIPQFGLRMVCPICQTSAPKPDISSHFETCLEKQLDIEPLQTTCTMICTLNSGDLLSNGVKTLALFVRNVANSPDEEKYKKIRVNNAGVQKKVMPLIGGVEFLELAGFTRIFDDTDGQEYFIMLDMPTPEHLTLCVNTLESSKKLVPTLDRDVKILRPSAGLQKFEFSSDFYRVTKEDLLTEHKRRTEEAERSDMLRTKVTRDRDAGIGMRIYHYTIIRIRFPDGVYLQGTFSAHDSVESVFKFVESSLRQPTKFSLVTPGSPPLTKDKTILKAAGLVPSGVLNFSTAQQAEFTFLSDDLVCKLADL